MKTVILKLLTILFKKEENEMVTIYVALIIKGLRKYSSVPETIKAKVRQMLIDLELEDLIDEFNH